MLALCLLPVEAQFEPDIDITGFTKEKISFRYKFPDGIPDEAAFHLVPSSTYNSPQEVIDDSLGEKLVENVPDAAEEDYQADHINLDDDILSYTDEYDFCVLVDTDDDGTFDDYSCEDVELPLEWGSFTTSELKEGSKEFELRYDIAAEEDTQSGGPLFFAVYHEDKDPTVDEIKAGTDSIVSGNGVATVTAGETSGTHDVTLQDHEELLYHQRVYISTVLQIGANEYSNVVTENFRVEEHDWGWKIGEIIGLAFGVILLIAMCVGLIMMCGPGGACAVLTCCAAASIVD